MTLDSVDDQLYQCTWFKILLNLLFPLLTLTCKQRAYSFTYIMTTEILYVGPVYAVGLGNNMCVCVGVPIPLNVTAAALCVDIGHTRRTDTDG